QLGAQRLGGVPGRLRVGDPVPVAEHQVGTQAGSGGGQRRQVVGDGHADGLLVGGEVQDDHPSGGAGQHRGGQLRHQQVRDDAGVPAAGSEHEPVGGGHG